MNSHPRTNEVEPPSYEALAAEEAHLPNSRFGRWRSWIEKRARERYLGNAPDPHYDQQHQPGWGENPDSQRPPSLSSGSEPDEYQFEEEKLDLGQSPFGSPSSPGLRRGRISSGHRIACSSASLHNFGSRFIPHSASRINALLPILSDRFLLLGTDDGLSVLDLLPGAHGGQENSSGCWNLGDSKTRVIWKGDAIYQLAVLEASPTDTTGILQGVVLALVGHDSGPSESRKKMVRMYKLSSLCSLVTFMVNQPESAVVDLGRPAGWSPQNSLPKGHKSTNSIARGFLSLIEGPTSPSKDKSTARRSLPAAPGSTTSSLSLSPPPSIPSETGWDLVNDTPLRWATDYIPLAPGKYRAANSDITRFELLSSEDRNGRSSMILAVASKSNILIYEALRSERVFRCVQELYTPFPCQNVQFVYQTDSGFSSRHSFTSSVRAAPFGHKRHSSAEAFSKPMRMVSSARGRRPSFGAQLSLFVTFEKRAAVIRLSTSGVQAVNLYEEKERPDSPLMAGSPIRQSRRSHFEHVDSGTWLPLTSLHIPPPPSSLSTQAEISRLDMVYIFTKGRRSHVIQSPLPNPLSASKPLTEFTWRSPVTNVTARTCYSADADDVSGELQLQLLGFGPQGVEVVEIPVALIQAAAHGAAASVPHLSTSTGGKGKERELPDPPPLDPLRAQVDLGGDTAFLCVGGHWHDYEGPWGRSRERGTSSIASTIPEGRVRDRSGVYACAQRGLNDYRVFFIGDHVPSDSHD